jgi:hypothetical protein
MVADGYSWLKKPGPSFIQNDLTALDQRDSDSWAVYGDLTCRRVLVSSTAAKRQTDLQI